MTRLILKAIDFGASAVFMALCTKAFCGYLFKQPQLDLFNQRRIIRVGLRVVDPLLTFLSVPCSTSDGATRFSLPRFFSQCSPGSCFGCSTIIYPRRRSARRRQSMLTQSVPASSVPPIECSHRTKEREIAKDPTSEGDQRPQHYASRHDHLLTNQ